MAGTSRARVVHADDSQEERIAPATRIRTVLGPGSGCPHLTRRLVEIADGARYDGVTGPGGELWFVIRGSAELDAGRMRAGRIGQDTGVWLPAGVSFSVTAGPGGLELDAVRLPGGPAGAPGAGAAPAISRLASQPVQVTGDRRFRVLHGPGTGCSAATQFAGQIPPGRAPAHRHPYDEVVLILAGEGLAHVGGAAHPVRAGSYVYLPPGEPHCLENTGRAEMRVLGVFHPADSPASKEPTG